MAVVILALATFILWQQQRTKHLTQDATALRERVAKTASLRDENQRLAEELEAARDRSQTDYNELMRLRGQAGKLREAEQEIVRLKAERERQKSEDARTGKAASSEEPEESWNDRQHGPGSQTRVWNGMRLGMSVIMYANKHQGQYPASFQEALPFLDKDLPEEEKAMLAAAADQYEILYHGHQDALTNPPPEAAILLREKQPWLTTKGKWARAYIKADGSGHIGTSPDGNFDKYEGPRIPK